MPGYRATERRRSPRAIAQQPVGEWRPAPAIAAASAPPLPAVPVQPASEVRASPFGHRFGDLALYPEVPAVDPAGARAAQPGPIAVQRLIYKDEKARDEKGPYADITKVPWYERKKSPEDKALILPATKIGAVHLTTAETNAML